MKSEERAEWNQKLFEKTQYDWSLGGEQCCMIGSLLCVFAQVNDARIFVVGEEDEILLYHFLESLLTVLQKVVLKTKITWNGIVEDYPKVSLAVREMVSSGRVEHLNADPIDNILKLKQPYCKDKH
ncbi:uncharacterized protein MONOS_18028 [Monocercomonoides exilis]|uniref:uncharacterized protein n=1 Tax=Monocercomonoides exilis TaxID=2049356 RepID=UPI00355A5347|nr:hypothetical protein MONOS_18028 [Monocercomonoides exilis]